MEFFQTFYFYSKIRWGPGMSFNKFCSDEHTIREDMGRGMASEMLHRLMVHVLEVSHKWQQARQVMNPTPSPDRQGSKWALFTWQQGGLRK